MEKLDLWLEELQAAHNGCLFACKENNTSSNISSTLLPIPIPLEPQGQNREKLFSGREIVNDYTHLMRLPFH